jgi:hypothetical protein
MTIEDNASKLKKAIAKLALLEGIEFEVALARLAKTLKISPAKLELEVQAVRSAEAERKAKTHPGRFVKGQRNPGQNVFKPGQSGNPSGKSRSIVEITKIARDHCEEGILELVSMPSPHLLIRPLISFWPD